jgi:hypothetical protein
VIIDDLKRIMPVPMKDACFSGCRRGDKNGGANEPSGPFTPSNSENLLAEKNQSD